MTSFGDGESRVGVDIAPGLYRARLPSDDCKWSRDVDATKGLVVQGRIPVEAPLTVVEIAPDDTSFTSSGCGGWSEVEMSTATPVETFGDGTFLVGSDIAPGRYRATGSPSCYWLRLDSFEAVLSSERPDDWNTTRLMVMVMDEYGDTVAGDRYPIVDIEASDGGFFSHGCGTWSSDVTVAMSPGQDFGDGLFLVGSEIAPGRYRALEPSDGCRWERLNHFSGELSDWLGWDGFAISRGRRSDVRPVVDIEGSDAAFYSSGCGTWSSELTPIASPGESFPDGTYIVGVDIAPGRYRATTPTEDCLWFRLYDFGGIYGAYEGFHARARGGLGIVDIAPSDAGFTSRGCGRWSPDQVPIVMPGLPFGDGTYLVGAEIMPGRYYASVPTDSCYWTRLRSFDGDTYFGYELPAGIIGYGDLTIVDILQTDVGFLTSGCGTWSGAPPQVSEPKRAFGDGSYVVGTDIEPGRYFAATPTRECEWDRLDAFDGYDRRGEIGIGGGYTWDRPSRLAVVDVRASDAGFRSSGCGEWTQAFEARVTPEGPPGDGFFLVGIEVAPGRYRATTPESCTFERRGEFSGEYLEGHRYIDEGWAGRSSALAIVDIESTDAGFESEGCGWSADLTPTSRPGRLFGDGTYVVGAEVAPGRYRAQPSSGWCSWMRLGKFGGSYGNDTGVVGRWWVRGRSEVVDIAPTDAGFHSSGCGTWSPELVPELEAGEPFTGGTYLVDTDLSPGRYRAATPDPHRSCYWARLSGFGGAGDVIASSEFRGESFIVEIGPSDVGFSTDPNCGAWMPDTGTPMRSVNEPIDAGVYYVGTEITPGRYRATSPSGEASCQWWRLGGFGGTPGEVLGSYALGLIFAYSFIVDIAAADAGFASTECGTWTRDLTPVISPSEPFSSGSWLVGPEVAPGRYRNTPGDTSIKGFEVEVACEWQRVSGFTGAEAEIIEAGRAEPGAITSVEVAATDVGFVSSGCGTWTLVPP